MSKHAVVVEDGQRTKRIGRRLKVGAGIFGGMMAVGTGVAVAAWLVTGSGTGSVSTQGISNLQISVGSVGGLYPGSSASGTVTVGNVNNFPVQLNTATITSDSPCYSVTINLPSGTTVPSLNRGYYGNLLSYVNLDYTAAMPSTADSTCAGATFTPTVTVNGQVGS
jgi:hypothetical protein